MPNAIVQYQRAQGTPWVAIPSRIAHRSLRLFMTVGTYHAVRFADGTVQVRS
ncbi:hypothetical protein [Synechococcus phage Ssp-JY38]|nr:hypothetical protein [Synechococcus phage Yong-L2-223]